MGRHLPLLRLDTKASNLRVLEAWVATIQGKRSNSKLCAHRYTGRNESARADIHRPTLKAALGDASNDFLGMRTGADDHVPIGVRMGKFHQRPERSDDVRDPPVRVSGRQVSFAHVHCADSFSWP